MGHKHMGKRMAHARAVGALPPSVIARILPEDHGKEKSMEEIVGNAVKRGRAQALAVSLGALPKGRVVVRSLFDAGIKRRSYHSHRLKGIADEQVELLPRCQSADLASRLHNRPVH